MRWETRGRGRRAANAWGQVAAAAGGAVGRVGEQWHPGPARWAACVRAGAGWAAKPSGWLGGPLLLFLFVLSFISFPLFEFKFGLEFEFKTDVTYSLEFREFCLILTLWFITLMELFSIT